MALPPLRFRPILKRALWGGRRLGTRLGKALGQERDYAESWEVSDLPDQESIVANGPLAGLSIRDLVTRYRDPFLGRHAAGGRFPLLAKFLDAQQNLSVQVHPGPDMSDLRPEVTTGKAETWVVLEADPGSRIYLGLLPGTDAPQLRQAVADRVIEELLQHHEVTAGDSFFFPPGVVHCLGAGILLAEVSQPNDVTYRLYDWDRVGPDGSSRELHIDLALAATDFELGNVHPLTPAPLSQPGCPEEIIDRIPVLCHSSISVERCIHVSKRQSGTCADVSCGADYGLGGSH